MAEKDSGTNDSVRGYNLIDEAKKTLEAASTRDTVALSRGPKYNLWTGRRDRLVSNINDVNIPGSDSPVSVTLQFFASKGITKQEMVTLFRAHTVGFYKEILAKKGLLQIDQQLALDAGTKGFVLDFASNGDKFQKGFANAIVKMGEIDVLVGNQGEIRKKCSVFNRN
ncbi:hypothetical protein GYH30_052788 [Glycine max]|uniref:peroxidase n=1 Tax=Glycine max TaxID=3847 RepID=A0A0R0EX11_SOYBN|nr:hypothetical protein GYH30_052788 [Glycine max]